MHLLAPHRCTQISGRAARLSPKFHTVTAAGLCPSLHPGCRVPGGPGGSRPAAPGAPPPVPAGAAPTARRWPGGTAGGSPVAPNPHLTGMKGMSAGGHSHASVGRGRHRAPPPNPAPGGARAAPGEGAQRGGGFPSIAPWGAPGVRPLLCPPPPEAAGGPLQPPQRGGEGGTSFIKGLLSRLTSPQIK